MELFVLTIIFIIFLIIIFFGLMIADIYFIVKNSSGNGCDNDADCPQNQFCFINPKTRKKVCELKQGSVCSNSSQCRDGFSCSGTNADGQNVCEPTRKDESFLYDSLVFNQKENFNNVDNLINYLNQNNNYNYNNYPYIANENTTFNNDILTPTPKIINSNYKNYGKNNVNSIYNKDQKRNNCSCNKK